MTDRHDARLEAAVQRKKEASRRASRQAEEHPGGDTPPPEEQRGRIEHGRPQDARSVREKSAGKGRKTADKWNQ